LGVDAVAECDAQRIRPDASEVMVLQADPSKAKTLLGWEAEIPLEDGLRQTADWLLHHQHLYRPDRYQL
jgi:nucleoside-diphosphate-sugar epimerase